MPEPIVAPVSYQILHRIDQPEFKVDSGELPLGEYRIYFPLIGEGLHVLGTSIEDPNEKAKITQELLDTLTQKYNSFFEENCDSIQQKKERSKLMSTPQFNTLLKEIETICSDTMKNEFNIRRQIIWELYRYLHSSCRSWKEEKKSVLTRYQPVFSLLVKLGAKYDLLRASEEGLAVVKDLLNFGLDKDAINAGFSHMKVNGGAYHFGLFEKSLELYIPAGADIDSYMYVNPKCGTFLHVYIANELQYVSKLIALLEKYRNPKRSNTQFNYKKRDEYGNTPLLLAIRTRNESAVFSLLELEKRNISVGIDLLDSEGRSPLMLASAYGMEQVVEKLLEQGADVCVKDKEGRTFKDYISLNEKALSELIAFLIHPRRVNATITASHSHLYANDDLTLPLCYYPDGQIRSGKEQEPYLIVLSNDAPHSKILDEVLEILKRQAKKDPQSEKNYRFAERQIDDIRFSAQLNRVFSYLEKNQQVAGLEPCYDLVKNQVNNGIGLKGTILNFLIDALEQVSISDKDLSKHTDEIKKLKNSPVAPSFIEECLNGQKKIITYLKSRNAQKLINLSKQKGLRRAAALGDLPTVALLLKENIDPSVPEFKGPNFNERNALDYAAWRVAMVEDLVSDQQKKQGRTDSNKKQEAEEALKMHPLILKALLSHSVFSKQTKERVITSLRSDLDHSDNPLTRAMASECLEEFEPLTLKGP